MREYFLYGDNLDEATFWEINTTILREQYPGLLEEILRDGDDSGKDLKIETAASGAPTLVINGRYVHSPRDPQREGARLAASLTKPQAAVASAIVDAGAEAVVVLGFGLGYAAQALAEATAEMSPQRPIIIVEKNPGILRKALELRDLSSLLTRPGVAFLPGESGEGISAVLALFEKRAGEKLNPYVMRNRTLTDLDEQWYAAVENHIRSWSMRDDVNMATLKKFGKRWTRNLSRNMTAIRDLPGISRLAGIAADTPEDLTQRRGGAKEEERRGEGLTTYSVSSVPPCLCENSSGNKFPVFLAAAGPGLDEIVSEGDAASLLTEIHKRCIIVAVDTSLRFLLRNGVEPDFALVVDPQFWNSRHLNRCASAHTRLIIESAAYPPVLRLPFQGMYLCGSLYPMGIFIEQRVDPKGALGAGGSVATSAWDFARILGAERIWLAGLDLAFPAGKTHFRGAQFEEQTLAESDRLNPAETWLIHALRDGGPFKAPAMSGGEVLSDRRLSLYASWFENRFRQFPFIRNYSLSTHGLSIPGMEPAGTKALLALPERRTEINRRLQAAFSRIEAEFYAPQEAQRRSERYENAVAALRSGLHQIQNACTQGIQTAEQALKCDPSPAGREKILAALDEINRFITESEVKEIAGFLFSRDTLSAISGQAAIGEAGRPKNENAAFQAYLKSTIRLYSSLAEAAEIKLEI